MASTLIKMVAVMVMLNIFIYLGLNLAVTPEGETWHDEAPFRLEGDFLDRVMSENIQGSIQSMKENYTDYSVNFSNEFTTFPLLTGGEEASTGSGGSIVSFLDSLNIVIEFARMLFNIAISPITLFSTQRLNPIFLMIFGIPYFIIFIITLIALIRGVSD